MGSAETTIHSNGLLAWAIRRAPRMNRRGHPDPREMAPINGTLGRARKRCPPQLIPAASPTGAAAAAKPAAAAAPAWTAAETSGPAAAAKPAF